MLQYSSIQGCGRHYDLDKHRHGKGNVGLIWLAAECLVNAAVCLTRRGGVRSLALTDKSKNMLKFI
jgi:hypothetical protein